jgi:UDP-N-acetylmuramyl pentapeptide phosphotransferase/UDP-N-acetylglucosamine-1-phosphate transferase
MRKLGMIDQPSERRINKTPVPRGGGVAVFIAFHLTLAVFVCLNGSISEAFSIPWQVAFFIGSLGLATIGFIDDKFGMKPLVKLLGQVAVASLLFFADIRIGGILSVTFPPWLDYAVTVFWIVGAVNAFNLIDGMDGLASGLALIASIGLAGSLFFTGYPDNMIPYLALGGACLGFLRYNFHPATVFLGDTGSMFLGLCMATLPLVSGSRLELFPALIVPLLAMGIPIFDTILAIWRRTVRALLHKGSETSPDQQTRIMGPDKDHLHHRILRSVVNQRRAAWILYSISVALVAVGLFATLSKRLAPGIFLIAFIAAVIVIVKHLASIELWDTGRLLSNRRILVRKGLVLPLYVMYDLLALSFAWLLTYWTIDAIIPKSVSMMSLPLRVGSVFIFLVLAKIYWRVWQRAQFSDFALLLGAVVAGTLVSNGLILFFTNPYLIINPLRFGLVFAAFSTFLLIIPRLAGETLRGIMQVLKRHTLRQRKGTEKLLVYGAGLRFRNYMREQSIHLDKEDSVIIGIIEDDLLFAGRIIYGYNILGNLDNVPAICRKYKINRIVITCVLDVENLKTLLQMAKKYNFKVSVWVTEEQDVT